MRELGDTRQTVMFEVVFIGDEGVGVDVFAEVEVAGKFAARMEAHGFEVLVAVTTAADIAEGLDLNRIGR
jgi:hypothetical protein